MRALKVFSITKKSPHYKNVKLFISPFHTKKILDAAHEGRTSVNFCHKTMSPELIAMLQNLGYTISYIKKPKWYGLSFKFIVNVSWDVGV